MLWCPVSWTTDCRGWPRDTPRRISVNLRLVRRNVACWAMAGRVRCSARLEGNRFIPPPCSSVCAHLLIFRTWLLRQLVKILDKGHHRAIEAMYARVCRFDDVIFIGRVSAAAVAETEVTGR